MNELMVDCCLSKLSICHDDLRRPPQLSGPWTGTVRVQTVGELGFTEESQAFVEQIDHTAFKLGAPYK